jgi:hypothetical protein
MFMLYERKHHYADICRLVVVVDTGLSFSSVHNAQLVGIDIRAFARIILSDGNQRLREVEVVLFQRLDKTDQVIQVLFGHLPARHRIFQWITGGVNALSNSLL